RASAAVPNCLAHVRSPLTAPHLREHVVHHPRVLDLRAEEDDLGVIHHAHAVSWWPVEQVVGGAGLLPSVGVGDDDFTGEHVAPMRGRAGVTLQPFQQWSNVGAGPEREVLASERGISGGITETLRLARDRTGHVDLDRDLVLGDAHATPFRRTNSDHLRWPLALKLVCGRSTSSNTEPVPWWCREQIWPVLSDLTLGRGARRSLDASHRARPA